MTEEALPENAQCGILKVLGSETDRINLCEARILSIDDMPFNQLHVCHPGLPTEAAGGWVSSAIRRSPCTWSGVAQTGVHRSC